MITGVAAVVLASVTAAAEGSLPGGPVPGATWRWREPSTCQFTEPGSFYWREPFTIVGRDPHAHIWREPPVLQGA